MKIPLTLSLVQSLKQVFSYGPRMHPVRDWFMLLSSLVVLLGASVLLNLWLYNETVRADAVVAPAGTSAALEVAPIDQAHALFDARLREQTRFQNEYHFIDPK